VQREHMCVPPRLQTRAQELDGLHVLGLLPHMPCACRPAKVPWFGGGLNSTVWSMEQPQALTGGFNLGCTEHSEPHHNSSLNDRYER